MAIVLSTSCTKHPKISAHSLASLGHYWPLRSASGDSERSECLAHILARYPDQSLIWVLPSGRCQDSRQKIISEEQGISDRSYTKRKIVNTVLYACLFWIYLRCWRMCRQRFDMESLLPEVSFPGDTESTSSACLKNSSFLRWKRASTLLTAKDKSFNVNRHGFGSRRMRYESNSKSRVRYWNQMKGKRNIQGHPKIQH